SSFLLLSFSIILPYLIVDLKLCNRTLSIIKVKKEEKESYIKALTNSFDLEHTFIQETLNKLAERPKTDTQLDLFSYDTG
ncbi:hypothetical protein P7E26_15725, partial [Enterococcus gallinarum]|nr:hypothetical protein [Enterococcus gallinarum]